MSFAHLVPEYIYDDRFTARWNPYTGSDFREYRIYLRPSSSDIATWVPSGDTALHSTISDKNTVFREITGLTAQTEYDVCVAAVKTNGVYVYDSRNVDSSLWTLTTGIINFAGGARHVNTTAVNEAALFMDGDIYGGPFTFSVINGVIKLGTFATQDNQEGLAVEYQSQTKLFKRVSGGIGTAIEHGSTAWSWVGQFPLYSDRVAWPQEDRPHTTDDRYYIWGAVSRSADKLTWSSKEYLYDSGLTGYKLIAGGGKPIALSDGSEILPLYISPEASPTSSRTNSLVAARTTDGGQTFSIWGSMYPYQGTYIAYGEPSFIKIGGSYPNEHLVCVFRTGSYKPRVTQSLDSGLTWTTDALSNMGDSIAGTPVVGNSMPRLYFDGSAIYCLVGNRAQLSPWNATDNAAYLFKLTASYTGSYIPDLATGWNAGLKLGGGNAATSNFDVCFYGDVTEITPGYLTVCYFACVGSPKSYGLGGTSNPYIAMKIIDKGTFTEVPFTKYTYNTDTGVTLRIVNGNFLLAGTSISVIPGTPGVRVVSELAINSESGGTLRFTGGDAAKFSVSLNGTDWTDQITIPTGASTAYVSAIPDDPIVTLTTQLIVPTKRTNR